MPNNPKESKEYILLRKMKRKNADLVKVIGRGLYFLYLFLCSAHFGCTFNSAIYFANNHYHRNMMKNLYMPWKFLV